MTRLLDHIMNCGHSRCLRDSRVSCCQVLSLARCTLIQIFATPSKMGDVLLTASKRSNSTFVMLDLYHEMDVDYSVVDELVNIKIVGFQMHV
jgi:hypothetical protein